MDFLSENKKGTIYAIISALCNGFMGYYGMTILNAGLSPYNMSFWRFLITSILMLFVFIPKYKICLNQYKESILVFFYGITTYGLTTTIYFVASKRIGSGLSMVIFFVYPAIVMLLNVIFYKSKVSKIHYVAFIMIFTGVIFMVNITDLNFDFLGLFFAILSAAAYAIYVLKSKHINIDPIVSTFMVCLGCAFSCFICSIIDSSFIVPNQLDIWINIFCMAIFCTAIPILFLLKALQYISAEKSSMLSVLQPVFVLISGIFLLNEPINNSQIIGATILLSGVFMTFFSQENNSSNKTQ
jgi:hypothetical protein